MLRGLVRNVYDINGKPAYQLTEDGSRLTLRLIAEAKAIESELLGKLGTGEAAILKSLLNRFLHAIDPQGNPIWQHTEPSV